MSQPQGTKPDDIRDAARAFTPELRERAEEIEEASAGDARMRGLVTVMGNPVLSSPNGERLAVALDELVADRHRPVAYLAEAVGGDDDWQLVAMATVGWPDEESPSRRTPVSEFVTWD